MVMDIKNLELTDDDFKLIVSGLDALPQKDLAGEMMGDIILNMVDGGDPVAKERAKVEREKSQAKGGKKRSPHRGYSDFTGEAIAI